MGHVSRCIGLIHKLEKQGNTCVVAGSEDQLHIFKTYFPTIETISHEGYPFSFSSSNSFFSELWKKKRNLFQFIRQEPKQVEIFVASHKIDLIIADHRYGFRTRSCTSIFLTHQVTPRLKGVGRLFLFLHNYWINLFDYVWIVDDKTLKLGGELSDIKKPKKQFYIGILSRFEKLNPITLTKKPYALLLLSGPGVHYDFLYRLFNEKCPENEKKIIIGSPAAIDSLSTQTESSSEFIATTDWKTIDLYMIQAQTVYSFSGYTTLMDLHYLEAKKHLIPCPNQWEQVYLSEIHPNN